MIHIRLNCLLKKYCSFLRYLLIINDYYFTTQYVSTEYQTKLVLVNDWNASFISHHNNDVINNTMHM